MNIFFNPKSIDNVLPLKLTFNPWWTLNENKDIRATNMDLDNEEDPLEDHGNQDNSLEDT